MSPDAFAAAFDVIWMQSEVLDKALKYALAEAAMKVQHVGAREGLPTMKELERFMRTHRQSSSGDLG